MIAVVGSYGAGLTMRTDRMPVAGETLSSGVFSAGHGGKGSNQAVAAARLGSEVSFLTAIGEDDFGVQAVGLWREAGIDASHVVRTDAATMVAVILVEPSGENRIVIAPGALDRLTPGHVDAFAAKIASSRLLVVSLEIPLPVAMAALKTAREAGVPTLLNPAPAQKLPTRVWEWVDVFTPNASEMRTVLGLDPDAAVAEDDLVDELRQVYSGAVVVTLGSGGALVDDGVRRFRVPPVAIDEVVDTTGAGDAFTGALAHRLESGDGLEAAVKVAAAAGAYSVGLAEVIPSIPTTTQLNNFKAKYGDAEES